MKRSRNTLLLLSVVGCLTACATARVPQEKPSLGAPEIPPALVPQPEGKPLPPRDPRIAERWPPEIKQLVDSMLTLFPKTADERPPTVAEVEKKMGITLTERPLLPSEARTLNKQFEVGGTRFVDRPTSSISRAGYTVLKPYRQGGMTRILTLVFSPESSGFCLDPYELAVYTGSSFVNADSSPHATSRQWSAAYVWGMFDWSRVGRYRGSSFVVSIDADRRNETKSSISNSHCVLDISVAGGGGYQEEKSNL